MAKAKPAKLGRPPLPEGTAKSFIIRMKVSPAELGLIDELARRHGVDRSNLLRKAVYALNLAPAERPHTYDPSAPRVSDADFDAVYGKGASKTK